MITDINTSKNSNNSDNVVSGIKFVPIAISLLIVGGIAGACIVLVRTKIYFLQVYQKHLILGPATIFMGIYIIIIFLRVLYAVLGYGQIEKLKDIQIIHSTNNCLKNTISYVYLALVLCGAILAGYLCIAIFLLKL